MNAESDTASVVAGNDLAGARTARVVEVSASTSWDYRLRSPMRSVSQICRRTRSTARQRKLTGSTAQMVPPQ